MDGGGVVPRASRLGASRRGRGEGGGGRTLREDLQGGDGSGVAARGFSASEDSATVGAALVRESGGPEVPRSRDQPGGRHCFPSSRRAGERGLAYRRRNAGRDAGCGVCGAALHVAAVPRGEKKGAAWKKGA